LGTPAVPHTSFLLLAGNQLHQVPDSLTQLVHLQDLNLSGNFLQELPAGMSALTALTMLSLHGNQLQQLPQQGWQQLASLKEVTLQGNGLRQLPDSFAQLRVGIVLFGSRSDVTWLAGMASSCLRLHLHPSCGADFVMLPVLSSG
jgi:hypothetical protein